MRETNNYGRGSGGEEVFQQYRDCEHLGWLIGAVSQKVEAGSDYGVILTLNILFLKHDLFIWG